MKRIEQEIDNVFKLTHAKTGKLILDCRDEIEKIRIENERLKATQTTSILRRNTNAQFQNNINTQGPSYHWSQEPVGGDPAILSVGSLPRGRGFPPSYPTISGMDLFAQFRH